MSISRGKKIGRYEVISSIGAGAMGEVYRARDTQLGREVALKILPAEFSENSERLARFEQEARSASALNHPNIITIFNVGVADTTSYLSMELVEGKSLRAVLDEGRMTLRKVVNLASQLADGLAKAHAAGIVHRDLKPENLMISKDGLLKILDFGLAKLTVVSTNQAAHLQTQTSAGAVVGTPGYMSPEQASGKDVDFRADQFSFGTILYEMITGKRAFQRNSGVESMAAVITDEPEPVHNLNPQIPQVLRWVIDRCMAKDPEERYSSTRDLARDLQSIRDHISELSSVNISAVQQPGKRFRYWVASLLLITFLAGAAAAYWYFRPKPQEPLEMLTLTFTGKDSSPAVSPDGKLIAFRSDRDGTPRIWLKQLAADNEVVLSSGPDDHPRFSADSSSIFFVRRQGESTSLYRISVLGGEERKILDDVHSADLSPDGNKIAFVRWKSGESSLFTANEDGSGVELVTRIEKIRVQFPRWSPDGERIIATRNWDGTSNVNLDAILIFGMKTKEKRWLRSTWPTAAIWISNHQIIYGVPRSVSGSTRMAGTIVLQEIDTEKIRKLFWFPNCGDVLDRLNQNTLLLQSSLRRQNLRQISLAESPATGWWFTRGNSTDRQPVYSPDGKSILYSSIGSRNLDLVELTIETGAVRRITEDAADDWDPAYTPDGKHILWSSNRDGHFEIWMAKSDGTDVRRITNDGLDAENPTMTPDQRWIVYNSYNPKKSGIWKVRPDGSGATQLFSGLTQQPEVSPDGKHVAYAWYKQFAVGPTTYIGVINIETGKQIPFEAKAERGEKKQTTMAGSLARCRWMPDGKSLAYIDSNERGDLGIFEQDFIPGKDTFATRRAIAGFDAFKQTETFGISPDGKFITLSELELLYSLVRVENVPGL